MKLFKLTIQLVGNIFSNFNLFFFLFLILLPQGAIHSIIIIILTLFWVDFFYFLFYVIFFVVMPILIIKCGLIINNIVMGFRDFTNDLNIFCCQLLAEIKIKCINFCFLSAKKKKEKKTIWINNWAVIVLMHHDNYR